MPYSVVKIPARRVDLLLEAQKCGYEVIESVIELLGDIKKIQTPTIYSRLIPYISMKEATGVQLDMILDEIKKGGIFETDRIASDPYFSREVAGLRYYNWCKDILTDFGFMGVLYYKDTPVAFNLSKKTPKNETVLDGILGGLLPEGREKGLGFLVVYGENEICRLHNGKYCLGRVSSNNLPILKLHLQFGYGVKSISYVLIKHQ